MRIISKQTVIGFSIGIVFTLAGLTGLDVQNARAETVVAKKRTRVMSKRGESAKVVTRVKVGTQLKVLSRVGRWIKVRANGRTGWVTRTSVKPYKAAKVVRRSKTSKRRKRGKKSFVEGRKRRRGWRSSGPRDRVGADATDDDDDADAGERTAVVDVDSAPVYKKASKRSKRLTTVEDGDTFDVVETKGKWVKVRNSEGRTGWMLAKHVRIESSHSDSDDDDSDDDDDDSDDDDDDFDSDSVEAGSIALSSRLGLGYSRLSQKFRSNGVGDLANYDNATGGGSLAVAVGLDYQWKPAWVVGVDLQYVGMISSPGIEYDGASTAITTHDVGLIARFGYDFRRRRGARISARTGLSLNVFSVANASDLVANNARLPSERAIGFIVGTQFDMPRLTDKLGLQLVFDFVPFASRSQTVQLEDGASSSTRSIFTSLGVHYALTTKWVATGGYRLSYSNVKFNGAATDSMRPHAATEVVRNDLSHAFLTGIGRAF